MNPEGHDWNGDLLELRPRLEALVERFWSYVEGEHDDIDHACDDFTELCDETVRFLEAHYEDEERIDGFSTYVYLQANEEYETDDDQHADLSSEATHRLARLQDILLTMLDSTTPSPKKDDHRVFIVHGHDHVLRDSVGYHIQRLGLEPVILEEQANGGRTIIEKFEAESDVGFAVVLLTPDDVAGDTHRARQNVLFEMGYFAGKLGRRRVATLVAPGVDIPSDLQGVVYIALDNGGAWKVALAKELHQAGLDVDPSRLLA